jgi:hypothetical protein
MIRSDTGFAPGNAKDEFTNEANARAWVRKLDLSVKGMEDFAQAIYGGHFGNLDDIRGDQEAKQTGKISLDGLVPALTDLERGCRYNLFKAKAVYDELPDDLKDAMATVYPASIANIQKSIDVIERLRKATTRIVESISVTK